MEAAKEMVKIAYKAMDEHLGEDIKILDISNVSTIADYFMIVNGINPNQVQALVDAVDEKLSEAGFNAKRIEGANTANWILMDYEDIIVHIFSKEDRLFYDLERIWRDGKDVDISEM
jgi:ribosome-associated protein